MTKPTKDVLRTWRALNQAMQTADEEDCNMLLKEELRTAKRLPFVLRIHSRMNKIRASRERRELEDRTA